MHTDEDPRPASAPADHAAHSPPPARAAARRRAAGLTLALCVAGVPPALHAAPYTPASDDEIVQVLPAGWDAASRRQRAELARDPTQLPLALAIARSAIERARRDGDPRALGEAQAALAPWWAQATPPPAVRLLRATVRQSEHAFDHALADLAALGADPSVPLDIQAQAGLTQVAVLQVAGRLDEAGAACDALRSPRFAGLGAALSVPARACAAELRSLRGQPAQAAAELADLAREAPGDSWLALLRAELAQRMGDVASAEARFREALASRADVYTLAARADGLLDQNRPREVLVLLDAWRAQGRTAQGSSSQSASRAAVVTDEADALLLRRAIALHRLNDAAAPAVAAALQARFDAAGQRGQRLHRREEARLALDVAGDAPRALAMALENWAAQKEPADALLLWRAAKAAGQPDAAAVLRRWAPDPAAVDVRLATRSAGVQP